MNLQALRDPQKRDRYVSMVTKSLLERFRAPCQSQAVFVLGKQRSGTSMVMYALHRHPEIMVYDEHRNNRAFDNYCLRDLAVIDEIVQGSGFPAVCFKAICDSHRINELSDRFPDAHFIWMYRDYVDVANSTLRKFEHPTRAIRLVCEGKTGGGWFQEGISPEMQQILAELYREGLSDYELTCLVWWARNQIVTDCKLLGSSRLSVVKYEALVTEPAMVLPWLFERTGIPFHKRVGRRIHARSIRKNPAPPVSPGVKKLCDQVMQKLDAEFAGNYPSAQ